MDLSDLQKYKVIDLKKLLKDRHLSIGGNKPELIARLQATESTESLKTDATDVADPSDDILDAELDDSKDDEEEGGKDDDSGNSQTSPERVVEAVPIADSLPTDDNTQVETEAREPAKETVHVADTSKTAEERLVDRSKRFGTISANSKAAVRAKRFGLVNQTATDGATKPAASKGEDLEKLKKRADRFGAMVSTPLVKKDTEDRLLKRLTRFGAQTTAKQDDTSVALKRKQRFGAATTGATRATGATGATGESQAKLQKRAERFGVVQ